MTTRRPRIASSGVATGRGDDGTTGLLFGGPRVAKDDPATEAYGTIDEAVAALGVARAELLAAADAAADAPHVLGELAMLVLRLQRELFVVGAELATTPAARGRLTDGTTRVSEAMLAALETTLAAYEAGIQMPREFVVPGETRASAALEVARTVVRRAERRIVSFQREGGLHGEWLLPYVNRLADLLWVLARVAEQAASRPAVPARPAHRRSRSR
ncbi:MAG TPA: cob(I)yrinic acid a,c-diamide adenosyltransferase [Candidatus Sulfotelmatobacter sp.]|nr:cob(I)yrinic acid a,c-diamide adenosyltransferase [Candidatus Sulfotelmatobacter sp.]